VQQIQNAIYHSDELRTLNRSLKVIQAAQFHLWPNSSLLLPWIRNTQLDVVDEDPVKSRMIQLQMQPRDTMASTGGAGQRQ
jgi:hypothetical protein